MAYADIRVPLALSDSGCSSDDTGVGNSADKARNNRGATTRTNTDSGTSDTGSSGTGSSGTDTSSTDAALPDVPSADASADATGSNPLIQNRFWWFGTPNPTPPPSTIITETEPLAELPGRMRPSYGWFTENTLETCVLGLSNTAQGSVGPYGTATKSFSSRGC